MEYILKWYCLRSANGVNGEKKDIMFKDDKIVDSVSDNAKVIDVTDKIVMPAGVDIHAHIAGPKLVGIIQTRRFKKRSNSKPLMKKVNLIFLPSCPTQL